jgi:ABC-type sulfate transport system permease subunit
MKHLNYLLLATLPNMNWAWIYGCGLESDVGAVE